MYLKPLQHYIDEYDRQTVDICRAKERLHRKSVAEISDTELARHWGELLFKLMSFYDTEMFAGERWENKMVEIEKMMNRDRARDRLFASAEPPEFVICLSCRSKMQTVGKDLEETDDGQDRILFFFECPKRCGPRRAFFDNGEEYRRPLPLCPKCQNETKSSVIREGDTITMTDTCGRCGHMETIVFDVAIKPPPP